MEFAYDGSGIRWGGTDRHDHLIDPEAVLRVAVATAFTN
jgi:hypothetical protein